MPSWSNFKNNHDEGITQICCSHENSIYVQACGDALFAESALKSFISFSNDVHLKRRNLWKQLETAIHHYGRVPSVKCLQVHFLIGNKACACQSCVRKTWYEVMTTQLRE